MLSDYVIKSNYELIAITDLHIYCTEISGLVSWMSGNQFREMSIPPFFC